VKATKAIGLLLAFGVGAFACAPRIAVAPYKPSPMVAPAAGTTVVTVGGLWEGPTSSRLEPIARAAEAQGGLVRRYAWDSRGIDLSGASGAVVAIGYSYGGDTLARLSFAQRIDVLVLVDPVRHGFHQGEPIAVGPSTGRVILYVRKGRGLPVSSPTVTGAPVEVHEFDASHTGIVGAVAPAIVESIAAEPPRAVSRGPP
jgi:hypothetical protein